MRVSIPFVDDRIISQAGRADYKKKQREYFEAAINLVEIDLLRTGERIFLANPPNGIPPKDAAPYYISVTRGITPGTRELYPQLLGKPLSNIGIPLRASDDDAVLPLQALLNRCYEMGRYQLKIDYSKQPTPALNKSDISWTEDLIKEWQG